MMERVTRGPTVAEWLGMDATEEAVMELAVVLAKAIRRRREAAGLTQAEFAAKIGRSQSAVAKAECGQVSIGRMVSIHLAAGGRIEIPEFDPLVRSAAVPEGPDPGSDSSPRTPARGLGRSRS